MLFPQMSIKAMKGNVVASYFYTVTSAYRRTKVTSAEK